MTAATPSVEPLATADPTVLALGRPEASATEYVATIQKRLAAQDRVEVQAAKLVPMSSDGGEPDSTLPPWWLEDGEALHAAHPRSFFIPPAEHRGDVRTGESVRLSFAAGPQREGSHEPDAVEQLWVTVTAVHRDGSYRGTVEDEVRDIAGLSDGDVVDFEPRHVVAIAYDPSALGYDPTAWAVIDARITDEDEAPLALTFAELGDSDDGKRHWFAALDQQPPHESAWMQLGELTDRWPKLADVFQAGGGMWRREASTGAYRQV